MRCLTQRFAVLFVLLWACQSPRAADTVIDAIANGKSAGPQAAREAIALASIDELAVVRRGLVDALLHLDGEEFGAELRRALVDPHPMVRLQAARALERWGTSADLDALDQAAGILEEGATPESAGATAANAAVRIRLSTDPEPAQRALKDLGSDIPQVRTNAAVNLGYYRWPPSIAALQGAVLNETDELSRAMAACALGSFDAAAVAPVYDRLLALMSAPPMVSRRCAVKALSVSNRPEAADLIVKAVAEPDVLTRRWVIEGIGHLKAGERYKPVLVYSTRADADVAVRSESIRVLGAVGGPDIEKVWRLATTDAVARVRGAAIHELVRVGNADVLVAALRDPAWEVRASALIGLARRTASSDDKR